MSGQAFELVSHGRHWGEDRVVYADAKGELQSLTTNLTDFYPPDEFRRVAAGRAAFRTVDLIALWHLLDRLQRQGGSDRA